MIEFNWKDMILYGGGTACLIVLIDLLLMKMLPENQLDDGGINERIFANLSLLHIVILSLVIAISEELLFRGVIQTNFGLLSQVGYSQLFMLGILQNLFYSFLLLGLVL